MLSLIKISAPGWEKKFDTEEDMRKELYKHICNLCREGGDDGHGYIEYPVDENSTLNHLLSTACGAEYMVEETQQV